MNILIYIEPHPIRNRYESYGWIARKMLAMLQDEYINKINSICGSVDIRMLVSRHYNKLTEEFPELRKGATFIRMTEKENDDLSYYQKDWSNDPASIATWKELMNGTGEVTRFYESILGRVKDDIFDFDLVVYWGTNGAVRSFARRRGIHAVAMEQGCARSPLYKSFYIDANGVNGDAISRSIDLDLVEPLSLEHAQSLLPEKLACGQELDGVHNPLQSRHAGEFYANHGRNVLIPLQLRDDANVIKYSRFSSMQEWLQQVLPVLVDAGYTCFVKPHPAAADRTINLNDHGFSEQYVDEMEGAFWLDDIDSRHDYLSLLDKTDYMVTINSSMGFEAMLFGKPVIPMGDSPYNIGDGFPSLSALASGNIDHEAYSSHAQRVINLLLRYYLVPDTYALDFTHFVRYLQHAIKAHDIYLEKGPEMLTRFLLRTPLIEAEDVGFIRAAADPGNRFARQTPATPAAPISPVALSGPGRNSTFTRKLTKLRRDPARFMADSRHLPLRLIGRAMGGSALPRKVA